MLNVHGCHYDPAAVWCPAMQRSPGRGGKGRGNLLTSWDSWARWVAAASSNHGIGSLIVPFVNIVYYLQEHILNGLLDRWQHKI